MTHDHAEDAALCDAALRSQHLGSIGLIGSSAKWTRFRQKLADEGHDEAAIARITTPIGLPELTGKEPATIAVSVAASLLQEFERRGRRADSVARPRPGPPMTLFRGTFLDTPRQPVRRRHPARRSRTAACCVRDGVIVERGAFDAVRRSHPDEDVVDLTGGLVLPGFVDTHVHFPQVRMIGALGMPLLDWLERSALPEEARLADVDYAACGRRRSSSTGWRRPAPPRRWSSAPTSRPRSTSSSRRPPQRGCGSPAGSWSATGSCARTCSPRRRRPTTRGGRWPSAGTVSAATGTP